MLTLYFLSSRIKKKAVITTEIIFRAIAGMLELETEETTTANIKRLIVNSSGKCFFEKSLIEYFNIIFTFKKQIKYICI